MSFSAFCDAIRDRGLGPRTRDTSPIHLSKLQPANMLYTQEQYFSCPAYPPMYPQGRIFKRGDILERCEALCTSQTFCPPSLAHILRNDGNTCNP